MFLLIYIIRFNFNQLAKNHIQIIYLIILYELIEMLISDNKLLASSLSLNNCNKFLLTFSIWAAFLTLVKLQPTPTDNCLQYNQNNSVCTQCIEGYYLQYWFCIPCNPRCACSSQDDYCQTCIDISYKQYALKSFLHQQDNQCYLCNATIPFCLQCSSLSNCTKCYGGRYVIQITDLDGVVTGAECSSSTQLCSQNCIICDSQSQCEICSLGYFLFANKTCSNSECLKNCGVCQSQSSCLNCTEGYYLQDISGVLSCEPCMSNCLICTSSTSCSECFPSFNFQDGSCVNNGNSNCVYYTGGFSTCMYCQPGYSIFGGSCNQCSGCDICSAQFICTTPCQSGYSPFNYACLTSFEKIAYFPFIFMILYLIF